MKRRNLQTTQTKKIKDYFDDSDDEKQDNESFSNLQQHGSSIISPDYEEDPLDAFMANVSNQVTLEMNSIGEKGPLPEVVSNMDRDYEGYFKACAEKGADDEAEDLDYDSEGNLIGIKNDSKKIIEPLPPVDHSKITYGTFKRMIYKEHEEIKSLNDVEIADIRNEFEITVMGSNVPRPIQSFKHASFRNELLRAIIKTGYEAPTAIQAQGIPVALCGRDLIGLAKTGSGKTLSYVWPMIEHIIAQSQSLLREREGPMGLILAPTRELAAQIFTETKKFAKVFDLGVCAIFGGSGKWEMTKALRELPEIVVATPGRFIELVKSKATNLQSCTMVVLDEADRMFEMGFEYQMRSIVNNIRPDRITLMYSATMKKKVEGFAREMLKDPVRVVIGMIGQANPDIKQVAELLPDSTQKWNWLSARMDEFIAEGKVLVFAGSKADTEDIGTQLKKYFTTRRLAVGIDILHGDKDQTDRSNIMKRFKSGEVTILVATDIASRGLDIKNIATVINYDVPKNIETYVHRIGRTGRMGIEGVNPGTAFTLVTPKDSSFAVDLVKNLQLSGQSVSADLTRLAQSDPKWAFFQKSGGNKGTKGLGGGGGMGRGGLGFGPGGGPRAMTSSMLSDQTKGNTRDPFLVAAEQPLFGRVLASGMGGGKPLVGNTAPNPYIEGQSLGRGKHLTQPSWTATAGLTSAAAATIDIQSTSSTDIRVPVRVDGSSYSSSSVTVSNDITSTSDITEVTMKRKSRFSPLPVVVPVTVPVPAPSQPMKGFVRASGTLHSVSGSGEALSSQSSTTSIHYDNATNIQYNTGSSNNNAELGSSMKKKSRWDA